MEFAKQPVFRHRLGVKSVFIDVRSFTGFGCGIRLERFFQRTPASAGSDQSGAAAQEFQLGDSCRKANVIHEETCRIFLQQRDDLLCRRIVNDMRRIVAGFHDREPAIVMRKPGCPDHPPVGKSALVQQVLELLHRGRIGTGLIHDVQHLA